MTHQKINSGTCSKSFTILQSTMFKKPVKIGAQNQLSGKDKKSIKNKLIHQFDPETVQKIFSTYDKIICNKISGSKMLIYTTDQYPLFVDGTGKEDYFLSVYTCTAFETLAKSLYINEGVQEFIFNGANLMWPGVRDLSRLGNFKKDDIVAIKNFKNEVIAVGALGCSLDELKTKTDGNGIAVYILNFKGDKLWDMGNKVYPEAIVKAKEEKVEVAGDQKVQETVTVPAQKEESSSEEEVEVKKEEVKAKGKGPAQKQKKEESQEEKPEQPVKGKGKAKKDKKAQKNESQEEQKVEEAPKGKGKGKKQKKVESDQEKPEEPVRAKGKGKKEAEQKAEEPQKGKGKGKKQKKVSSQEEVIEEPVKGKGKGKKETKQAKPEPKPEPKKKEESESDNDVDFGNLVHTKQAPRVQVKNEKKVIQFSDEEDDKKGKKKGGKKGGNKKKESDDEEQVQAQKPAPKGKKPMSDNESEEQVKEVKKGQNKGKNKKKDSDEEQIEEKPEKKKGKGKKKQEVEEQENNEDQVKPEKKEQEGQQDNEEGAKSAINSQLMDEYFKEAFLNVLKLCKIQGELPIDSGRFFSDYMVLARPQGVKLEIKDTSFKKLGKFYEEMAKKKIIEFKPAKEKKGQQGSTITKILWENEELKNYFPTIKKMGEKDVEEKVEQYSKEKLKLTKTLQVDYVYKPSQELKKILFKKVVNYMPDKSEDEVDQKEDKKEIYLSERELKEKIEKYINEIALKDAKEAKEPKEGKEAKQGKDKDKDKEKKVEKIVTLNYKQNAFIYGLLKHQIEEYEQNLEKQEMMAQQDSDEQEKKKGKKDKNKRSLFKIERGVIVNKIFKLASPYYNMSDKTTGLNKFKEGVFKGIQLIADKVINKNVTKIIGIESFAPSNVQPQELVKQIHGFAHQLQVKFASSATVQNLPGKNAGKEIVVQGNFVDELEALFTAEFGIKKEHITIQNKLGKKKKN